MYSDAVKVLKEFTLKPCPFCGGIAKIGITSDYESYYHWAKVYCTECFVKIEGTPSLDKDRIEDFSDEEKRELIHAWNMRYGEVE